MAQSATVSAEVSRVLPLVAVGPVREAARAVVQVSVRVVEEALVLVAGEEVQV